MIGFILIVVVTYLIYYLFVVRKYDEYGNYKVKKGKTSQKKLKYPTEVEILILKYRIDLKKINFRALLKLVGLVCAIDIALIVTILVLLPIDNYLILLLVGFVLMFPVILISYKILGRFFKKKGLTKNGKF